jgi:transcriptional regulator with XRE-family HTH domain
MPDDDIKKLVDLIEAEVHRSRRSRRDLERALGLSHGYLGHLFSGRTEIKVRHILMLAEEVGFEPTALFNQAFGQALGQALGGDRSAAPATPLPPPMTEERVRDIARETIREELRRLVQPPATAEAPAAKA